MKVVDFDMFSDRVSYFAGLYQSMENQYANYEKLFDGVILKDGELPGIPIELSKVIKGTLGEQMCAWVEKEIPALDNKRVVDLVKTRAGINAVKVVLLRMG